MKKVKIMLLSFALLAVVGGALAFKAKFQVPICYTTAFSDQQNNRWTCTPPLGATLQCITTLGASKVPEVLGIQKICTTDPYVDQFGANPTCTTLLSPNVTTTASCAVLTTSVGD